MKIFIGICQWACIGLEWYSFMHDDATGGFAFMVSSLMFACTLFIIIEMERLHKLKQ
jgi:hypothetical protein